MLKVLFQSTNSQLLRATLIGYLYEIAQKHEVILVTEKIDPDTRIVLGDLSLFPGLKSIVFFEHPFGGNIIWINWIR